MQLILWLAVWVLVPPQGSTLILFRPFFADFKSGRIAQAQLETQTERGGIRKRDSELKV